MPAACPGDKFIVSHDDDDDDDDEEEEDGGNGVGEDDEESRRPLYVFVIAHPDDETMFFLPSLVAVRSAARRKRDARLWLVCLTRGNYRDLGSVRELELRRVGGSLGIDEVFVLDRPELPDHPTRRWSVSDAAAWFHKSLQDALAKHCAGAAPLSRAASATRPVRSELHVVTFDDGGVSRHVNHVDTYRAVKHWAAERSGQRLVHPTRPHVSWTVRVWTLETIQNPIRKYLPLGEWIRLAWFWWGCILFRLFFVAKGTGSSGGTAPAIWSCTSTNTAPSASSSPPPPSVTLRLHDPALAWQTMALHESQFVWYRRLSVVFSRYTYANRLRLWRPEMEEDRPPPDSGHPHAD